MSEDIKSYDELSSSERASRRELRRAKRELRKQERQQLGMAQSVSKKREIREYFDREYFDQIEEQLGKTRRPDSSSGGDNKGGVYDISTTDYSDTENSTSINNDINQQGIDSLGAITPDDSVEEEVTSIGHPFQLVKIDDTTIAVRKGTVNNVIAKIGATDLNDDYTLNTITIAANTTFYLKAISTGHLDTEGVTTVTVEPTDPGANTVSQAKQTLGSCTFSSGAIQVLNSNLSGSQNVDSCGTFHSWNGI